MKALLYLMSYAIILCSCTHDPIYQPYVCDDIYFEDDIRPILMKSCGSNISSCHFEENDDNDEVGLFTYYDIVTSSYDDLLDFDDIHSSELYEECVSYNCPSQYGVYRATYTDREKLMEWMDNGANGGHCEDLCAITEPTYENSIKKLMYNCTACHYTGSPIRVSLENYSSVYNADENYDIYCRVAKHEACNGIEPEEYMPPNYTLKACEIELIRQWIMRGKKEN